VQNYFFADRVAPEVTLGKIQCYPSPQGKCVQPGLMDFEGRTRPPPEEGGGDALDTSDRSFGHFFGHLGPKMTDTFLIFLYVRHLGGVGSELRHFSVVLKLACFLLLLHHHHHFNMPTPQKLCWFLIRDVLDPCANPHIFLQLGPCLGGRRTIRKCPQMSSNSFEPPRL
jgi:hypothetical protein